VKYPIIIWLKFGAGGAQSKYIRAVSIDSFNSNVPSVFQNLCIDFDHAKEISFCDAF